MQQGSESKRASKLYNPRGVIYNRNKQSKANEEGEKAGERKGGRASDRVTATGTGEETPAGGPKRSKRTKETNGEGNKEEKEKELKEGSGGSQRRRECGGPNWSRRRSFDVGPPSHSPGGE